MNTPSNIKTKEKYIDDNGIILEVGQLIDGGAGMGFICIYEDKLSCLWFGCGEPYSLEYLESWKKKDPFIVVKNKNQRKNWLELFNSKGKYVEFLKDIK